MMEILGQINGTEACLVGAMLVLLAVMQICQWQRDKANTIRMARVLGDKDRYAKELADQMLSLLAKNTTAVTDLTEALKSRSCLHNDPRVNPAEEKKEAQP